MALDSPTTTQRRCGRGLLPVEPPACGWRGPRAPSLQQRRPLCSVLHQPARFTAGRSCVTRAHFRRRWGRLRWRRRRPLLLLCGSQVADYLRDNSHTELLHLGGNELTDTGLCTIAPVLSTCAVRRLSLAGNNVQDSGAQALAAALADGYAPEQLDLSDNMITDEGALALIRCAVERTPSLRWVDLRLNPLISDEGRAAVASVSVGCGFDLML